MLMHEVFSRDFLKKLGRNSLSHLAKLLHIDPSMNSIETLSISVYSCSHQKTNVFNKIPQLGFTDV